MNNFEKTGFIPADILIPKDVSMEKWSVVACDQYTSQPEYWKAVEEFVGEEPSSLKVVFPEIYLEDSGYADNIEKINSSMDKYLSDGMFTTLERSFVYVERTFLSGKTRRGIVGAIDLENYDYSPKATSLVRATEKTVIERIPPRVKIRINAGLELPHIMLLIDDQDNTVVEPFAAKSAELEKVYDFELMQSGGHISGWRVPAEAADGMSASLAKLMEKSDLLFAVGDGNHSLATAKECWEVTKKSLSADEVKTHPARFALTEVVNIHDSSLEFEPIHRVLFDCDPQKVIDEFMKYYEGASTEDSADSEQQKIPFVFDGSGGVLCVENPPSLLTLRTLQNFLDDYIGENGGKLDYIHGDEVVRQLAEQPNRIGFLLPPMEKSVLFPAVTSDGALPRKTFSMGEAEEKRFYLECRKIK